MRTFWMVLGGAAAGAGLAYLFSPAGAGARRAIRETTGEWGDAARQCMETTSHVLADKAHEGQRMAGELLSQGQELAGQALETYHSLEEAVGPVREIAEHGKEAWKKATAAA